MGRGFVLCAVVCSALALAVYAGLFEPLGVPAAGGVFVLLALCLAFHGASIYLLKRSRAEDSSGKESPPEALTGKGEPSKRWNIFARP